MALQDDRYSDSVPPFAWQMVQKESLIKFNNET